MENFTTWVKELKDGVYDVKIGYFPEDTSLEATFDSTVTDIRKLANDIDSGKYDYFVAVVKYYYRGIEAGSSYLGGCLYPWAERALLEDGLSGYLEGMMHEAYDEAVGYVNDLRIEMENDFS